MDLLHWIGEHIILSDLVFSLALVVLFGLYVVISFLVRKPPPLLPPPAPRRPRPAPAPGWLDDLTAEKERERAAKARREAHYQATSAYFHPLVNQLLSDIAKATWGIGTGWRVGSNNPRSGYWYAEKGSDRFTVMLSPSKNPPKFVIFAKGDPISNVDTTDGALKVALREACLRGPKFERSEDPQEELAKKIARAMKDQ